MVGHNQYELGHRGQLEPGWHTGRKVGRPNNQRDAGRLGLDRDGGFDHRFVRSSTSSRRERIRSPPTSNNTGYLFVDYNGGEGGTSLNIKGTLTNTGQIYIGNTTLSASDKVTAASLYNTGYDLSDRHQRQPGAPRRDRQRGIRHSGTFYRHCLSGPQGAIEKTAIEFGSGQITSLAASSDLRLYGNEAFIEDSTALGSNSALAGLASIASGATLVLEEKVAVSTTGALANHGAVYIDYVGGDGGSSLKLAGALNNSGSIQLGNSSLSSSDTITASSLVNTGTIDLTARPARRLCSTSPPASPASASPGP